MIKFYSYPLSPNGAKVHLFLEEAGQPYQYEVVDLPKKEHLEAENMDKNLYGRIPFIDHDGFLLAESNVIMRYLAQIWEVSDWYPASLQERAKIEQWMEYGGVHINYPYSVIYLTRWFGPRYGWGIDIMGVDRALRDLKRNMPALETQLAETPYLTGPRPTLADLSLLPFLALSKGIGVPLNDYPHIEQWVKRMTQRQSWQNVRPSEWPFKL